MSWKTCISLLIHLAPSPPQMQVLRAALRPVREDRSGIHLCRQPAAEVVADTAADDYLDGDGNATSQCGA